MRTIAFLLLATLAAIPGGITAQATDGLPAGTPVRWRDGRILRVGRLVAPSVIGESLVVRTGGAPVSRQLSWDSPGLEYQSRRSRKGRGALIGLGIGAVAGVAIGFIAGDDRCGEGLFGCLFTFTAEQKAGMLGAGLGGVGALVGAFSAPGAQWTAAGPAAAPRLGLLLTGDRVGVRVGF